MKIENLKVNEILANPDQIRKKFDEAEIQSLANSIKANGLIQPITVVKRNGGYVIVSGERRFRAIQSLGLTEVKAIVIKATDAKVQELALIENIQRQDLTAIETVNAYDALIQSGMTVEQISHSIGKSTQSIKFYLCLNKLDGIVLKALAADIINLHTAWEIARLEDKDEQVMIYKKIITAQLKAAEAGSFITAFINAKNQLEIEVEEISEKAKKQKLFEAGINDQIAKTDLLVNKLYERTKNQTLDDLTVQRLDLLAKSLTRTVFALQTNNRNAELLKSLGKVV